MKIRILGLRNPNNWVHSSFYFQYFPISIKKKALLPLNAAAEAFAFSLIQCSYIWHLAKTEADPWKCSDEFFCQSVPFVLEKIALITNGGERIKFWSQKLTELQLTELSLAENSFKNMRPHGAGKKHAKAFLKPILNGKNHQKFYRWANSSKIRRVTQPSPIHSH